MGGGTSSSCGGGIGMFRIGADEGCEVRTAVEEVCQYPFESWSLPSQSEFTSPSLNNALPFLPHLPPTQCTPEHDTFPLTKCLPLLPLSKHDYPQSSPSGWEYALTINGHGKRREWVFFFGGCIGAVGWKTWKETQQKLFQSLPSFLCLFTLSDLHLQTCERTVPNERIWLSKINHKSKATNHICHPPTL